MTTETTGRDFRYPGIRWWQIALASLGALIAFVGFIGLYAAAAGEPCQSGEECYKPTATWYVVCCTLLGLGVLLIFVVPVTNAANEGKRFNPPPGWPEPPPGWRPVSPSWQPPDEWPDPPIGWVFWVRRS